MLRILQLLAPAQVGGLERVVQGLAAGLHDRGPHRADVVASGVPGDRAWMIRNVPVSLGSKLSRDEARAREMVGQELLESDQIRFHGNVPDAGRLLGAFDLLVLSSRTEGTPMILFEAMDAEVPVVVTEVGGVPDVVTDREAILVPSEDPESLARGIRRVLDTPADASRRAKRAGYRLRREFTPERWLDAYENLYHDVIASRRVLG